MEQDMEKDYQNWLWEKWAEICVKNLKKHAFDASFFKNKEKARKTIIERFSSYDTYGVGGSDTIRKIGILEDLKEMGKPIYDHWVDESLDIRLKQGRADCYFCSANAISLTGEIVNVDGVGNRTNAMTFGPKKVVIVAGMNKISEDLPAAIKRVHDIAAPMRAKSLGADTPCAESGVCNDCNSSMRLCRVTTILHRRPMLTDISVMLINEPLGF